MRFSWRRRRKFDWTAYYFLTRLILLLSTLNSTIARSFVGPPRRLQCMTCKIVNGDTTQLDQFRVRQNLHEPWCNMEPVECAPQQDTCVTVSMQVGEANLHIYLSSPFIGRTSLILDWLRVRSACQLWHSGWSGRLCGSTNLYTSLSISQIRRETRVPTSLYMF